MSACTAGQRDYCAAQQNVDTLLPSGNRFKQFIVIRNCLVFDLIGTTALFTAAIGDANAAYAWNAVGDLVAHPRQRATSCSARNSARARPKMAVPARCMQLYPRCRHVPG